MLNSLLTLIALCVLAFLGLMGMAYLYQDRMLFHPATLTPDSEQRFQPWSVSQSVDGVRLHGWYAPADASNAPLLVYYGGNAEEVSWNLPALRQLGVSVLLFNYRGYGHSEGTPSEATLKSDALALLDAWLAREEIDSSRVILMGRSLGSGVASYVASQRTVAGVILITPYDSLVAVGQNHYPWFPVSALMRNRFESIRLAPQLNTPLLSLLAENDRVVPPVLGQRLGAAWGGPVTEVMIEGADHISLVSTAAYRAAVERFIADLSQP